MLKSFTVSVVAALCAVFFLQAANAGSSAPARVGADPCAIGAITAAMGKKPADFTPAEQRQLVAWCKGEQKKEATAQSGKLGATGLKAGSSTRPSGPGSVAAPGGDGTAIWCGKKACFCWKGQYYNGCHHTDKLCASALVCGKKVCGCIAKD